MPIIMQLRGVNPRRTCCLRVAASVLIVSLVISPIPGSAASNERLAVIPGMVHRASAPKADEVSETAVPAVVGDLDPADEAPADGGLFG